MLSCRDTSKYDYHSQPYDPELHASVFSFVSCLSGLVVISIMFTNRVYILIKKGSGNGEEKENE